MSRDIIVLTEQVPAYLARRSPEDLLELNKQAAQGTLGRSINRISLKQSRFRLIKGGEEVYVMPEPRMNVILLLVNPHLTKTFYKKAYTPGQEAESPDCYSEDGIRPAADAKHKQHSNCAECPMNQWGSYKNPHTGKDGKACSDSKRIAIVPADSPDAEPFQLPVPADSMKELGTYLTKLSSANPPVPYNAVVTEVSFDTKAEYPRLLFTAPRYLTEAEYDTVDPRREDPEVKLVAGLPGMGFSANAQAAIEGAVEPEVVAEVVVEPEPEPKPVAQAQKAQPSGWGGTPDNPPAKAKEPIAGAAAWGGSEPATQDAPAKKEAAPKDPAPSQSVEVGDQLDDILQGWDLLD